MLLECPNPLEYEQEDVRDDNRAIFSFQLRRSYKNLKAGFLWDNIPMFAVLTGENGVGKSHVLELITKSYLEYGMGGSVVDAKFNEKSLNFRSGSLDLNFKGMRLKQRSLQGLLEEKSKQAHTADLESFTTCFMQYYHQRLLNLKFEVDEVFDYIYIYI